MNKPGNSSTIVFGSFTTLGWLVTFGLGLFIASKPYREQLLLAFEWKAFFVSLLTYTPTNIAALCLLAAFTGGCASRLISAQTASALGGDNANPSAPVSDSQLYMSENPFSSMFRGFAVYVAFLAGVYITSTAPFVDPTADQYARAAGATSLLAFVVGYDPTFFRNFISLAEKFKGK